MALSIGSGWSIGGGWQLKTTPAGPSTLTFTNSTDGTFQGLFFFGSLFNSLNASSSMLTACAGNALAGKSVTFNLTDSTTFTATVSLSRSTDNGGTTATISFSPNFTRNVATPNVLSVVITL